MSSGLRRVAAVILLTVSTVTCLVSALQYRRYSAASKLAYTRAIKQIDIRDTARNAFYPLADAAYHEQNYVLTGETIYAEACAKDLNSWRDEEATLELIASADPAHPLVEAFAGPARRAATETDAIMSIYEKSGRDEALARIRKGTTFVFIEQARDGFQKIDTLYGTAPYLQNQETALIRLFQGLLAISAIAVLSGLILLVSGRQSATLHSTEVHSDQCPTVRHLTGKPQVSALSAPASWMRTLRRPPA